VDDAADIARAAAEVDRITGGRGVDVLVNNAGYATAGALAELPDAELRRQFETNVFGLMAVTRALLPAMVSRGVGRVVNVSSVSGRIPAPLLGAYHASKYALEALSDALRMELDGLGVEVVVIEPGTIRTEFASRTMAEIDRHRPADSRYAAIYARAGALEEQFARRAADPMHVTRAIERAVEARRPRALRGPAAVRRAHRRDQAAADLLGRCGDAAGLWPHPRPPRAGRDCRLTRRSRRSRNRRRHGAPGTVASRLRHSCPPGGRRVAASCKVQR
jgi:short-subunit dehydrogenase